MEIILTRYLNTALVRKKATLSPSTATLSLMIGTVSCICQLFQGLYPLVTRTCPSLPKVGDLTQSAIIG